jgi:hypothetical protein
MKDIIHMCSSQVHQLAVSIHAPDSKSAMKMFFTGVMCVCVCAHAHINADNIELSYSLLPHTTIQWGTLTTKKKLKEQLTLWCWNFHLNFSTPCI